MTQLIEKVSEKKTIVSVKVENILIFAARLQGQMCKLVRVT